MRPGCLIAALLSGGASLYATPICRHLTMHCAEAAAGSDQPESDKASFLENHRFFSDTSPWNTPLPSGATYVPIPGLSALPTGLTSWDPTWDNVAIYFAHATDPIRQVLFNPETWQKVASGAWRRSGNSTAVEQQILRTSSAANPFPANYYSTAKPGSHWNTGGLPLSYHAWKQIGPVYVHVPPGAVPPPSSDGHMVVIQPDGQAMEAYSAISLSTGQIVASMFSFTPALSGLGVGQENGRTASMVEDYAGIIRDSDATAESISHALATLAPAALLKRAFTGPALTFDSNSTTYAGPLPMGSHLAVPHGLDLSSLGLQTSLGRKLAAAAQTYGMFIIDQGGSGVTLVTQANAESPELGSYSSGVQHDVDVIFRNVMLVLPQGDPAANAYGH
jgi:hypothetical protein